MDGPTILTPRELVEQKARALLEQAHGPVEAGDEVMSLGLLIGPDLQGEIMMMPFGDDIEKAGCAAALRHRCQAIQAIGVIHLCDTWFADGPDPEDPDGTRFRRRRRAGERPDRGECLIANCYLPDTVVWMRQKYWRKPEGVTWGEIERQTLEGEGLPVIDRFDPFPRAGRAPQPDLDEVAVRHGLGVRLVPIKEGEPLDLEAGESLTDPMALLLGELFRRVQDGILAGETDFPQEKPWEA